MFCNNCGKEIDDKSMFCIHCGTSVGQMSNQTQQPQDFAEKTIPKYTPPTTHTVPKCTCCGNIGELKPGPLLRKSDILWICLLFCLAGAGLIYLIFILIVRSDPNKREKICPKCNSVNMFTYLY